MRRRAGFFRVILAAATFASSGAAVADDSCATGRSEVQIAGPQPLIQELIKAVPESAGVFFEPGQFDRTQVSYIGRLTVARVFWDLVYLSTYWGESCRETKRLLVFNAAGSYVGNYGGIDQPDHLAEDRIIFPAGEQVQFDHAGPPDSLYLDGEVHSFDRP
jgi:hypothetical protein